MAYVETDEDGDWECEQQPGGIARRLIKPSAVFLARQTAGVPQDQEWKARMQARKEALKKLEDAELAKS